MPRFGAPVRSIVFIAALSVGMSPGEAGAQTRIQLRVDASELPRKLIRAELELEVSSGDTLSLLYPKWIPGIHGPRGPIKNLAGFTPRSAGEAVWWQRDWRDEYRFFVVPKSDRLDVDLSYIANQPSVNSKGVDSYGFQTLGIINWNTIVMYPEGTPVREIEVGLTLTVPSGWGVGSALRSTQRQGDTITFEPVSLEELIDRPLICGKYYRQVELAQTDQASYLLHIVADDMRDLPDTDSLFVPFGHLALEAEAMFGRAHFDSYHFLLAVSDQVPRLGLEHRGSSLNSGTANCLREEDWGDSDLAYLLPHEMVHAWVGKFRRPAGMLTPDYQSDKNTDLLWVYEGLTQYLGNVLAARSDLMTSDEFRELTVLYTAFLLHDKGRRWRPLQDTELSAHILRGGSESWAFLRRGQTYYIEGALTWLEFDARIRNVSNGQRSLDDFNRAFFSAGNAEASAVPFDLEEVLSGLEVVAEGVQWRELVLERIHQTQQEFPSKWLKSGGFDLEYSTERSSLVQKREKQRKKIYEMDSIGLIVTEGAISSVLPESPADEAGLYEGLALVGVNGKKYNSEWLREAVTASAERGSVELLVLAGEDLLKYEIDYSGGARQLTAVPLEGAVDRLAEICAPLRAAD
ncbi:MAG: hypothetical protein VX733_11950 [Candidatus Latescibacterota bacterium]|nr:hypothetical protein [Candidatus Latescibacterota bacterium]